MKLFRIGLITCCLWLVACVTTTTGDVVLPTSSADAAKFNMDLGIQYLQQGNFEEAMVKLQKSLDEESDNATAHWALGLVYEELGDPVDAEDEFRIAAKQAPDDPEALNQLASFLCRHGEPREALKYYDRALKIPLNLNRYSIATNAGICAKQIDLERAENYLREALAANPTFPDALYQLSEVAYRRENYLQSRAFIERRLEAAPAGPGVYWLGYRAETALNDSAAAESYARRLRNEFPESVEARLMLEAQRDGT